MTREMRLLLAASAAGALVWLAADELAMPARVFTTLLVGLLPLLLLLQAHPPIGALRDGSVLPVYVSSMAVIWALGVAAIWVGRASGFSREQLGLVGTSAAVMLGWTGAATIGAIAIAALFRALGGRESPLVEWLLPKTTTERAAFVLLSISAGVGEELAFRAFLLPSLTLATGSTALAVLVSSASFGLMHSYQQASGALRAGALGALMAVPFLATGSVFPSIAAHAAYDIIAGLALAHWLIGPPPRDRGDPSGEH